MRKIYNMKKTISIRQFISELGDNFSEHVKEKLKEIGTRCVLTRKEDNYKVNIKHVEHVTHECLIDSEKGTVKVNKEYIYGQFIVQEEQLYFSEKCTESNDADEASVVSVIFNNLNTKEEIIDETVCKLVDDSNIDYIIDSLLKACPPVSQAHLEMVQGMTYRSQR